MRHNGIVRWLFTMALMVLTAGVSSAATIVVNTTADDAVDDGACTLREAITAAVTDAASGGLSGECTAGSAGRDTVAFRISGTGPFTIMPKTPLPLVTQPIFFDGYSQPGAKANTLPTGSNAVILISVDGFLMSATCPTYIKNEPTSPVQGMAFQFVGSGAAGSRLRGLAIGGFDSGHPGAIMLYHVGGVQIDGNFIGLDTSGRPNSNAGSGIWVLNGDFMWAGKDQNVVVVNTGGNVIGGRSPAERNVIAANQDGITIGGKNNRVEGNYIGVNSKGDVSIPNRRHGVSVGTMAVADACPRAGRGAEFLSEGNAIGGMAGGQGNFFSADTGQCAASISTSSFNRVEGNAMGTSAPGAPPSSTGLGVQPGCGVRLRGGATRNRVASNRIAHSRNGIVVVAPAAANDLFANSITRTDEPGIDLGEDGVTVNDPDDSDGGANGLQNFPVALVATGGGGIKGRVRSKPNTAYRVDFYSNSRCQPQATGEAERYIGSTSVTTDASGEAAFSASVARLQVEQYVTATATNSTDGTSELAECVVVGGGLAAQVQIVSSRNPARSHESYTLTVLVSGRGITPTGAVVLRDLNKPTMFTSGVAYAAVAYGVLTPSASRPDTAEILFSSPSLNWSPTTVTAPPWGNLRLRADYSGDVDYEPATSLDFVQRTYREKSDLDGNGLTDLVLCDGVNDKVLVSAQPGGTFAPLVGLPQLHAGRILLGVGEAGLFSQPVVFWRDTFGQVGGTTFAGGTPGGDFDVPLPAGLEVDALGSLYGELKDDIVAHDANDRTYGILTSDIKGSQLQLYTPAVMGTPAAWRVRHTGDFDGDGNVDLLLADAVDPAFVWLMDGALHAVLKSALSYMPAGGTVVAVADFNGDGRSDVVWHLPNDVYEIVLQDGLMSGGKMTPPLGVGRAVVGTAHFDTGLGSSNGRSSLVVRDIGTGQLEAWMNTGLDANGLPTFGMPVVIPTGGRTDLTVCVP